MQLLYKQPYACRGISTPATICDTETELRFTQFWQEGGKKEAKGEQIDSGEHSLNINCDFE